MNWVDELWRWADQLVGRSDATGQIVLAAVLLLGVVLVGSWVQSRIAR